MIKFEIYVNVDDPTFRPYHICDMLEFLRQRIGEGERSGKVIHRKTEVEIGFWSMTCEPPLVKLP